MPAPSLRMHRLQVCISWDPLSRKRSAGSGYPRILQCGFRFPVPPGEPSPVFGSSARIRMNPTTQYTIYLLSCQALSAISLSRRHCSDRNFLPIPFGRRISAVGSPAEPTFKSSFHFQNAPPKKDRRRVFLILRYCLRAVCSLIPGFPPDRSLPRHIGWNDISDIRSRFPV